MACCGQTAAEALAAGLRVMDERIGQQTHVRIVYTGMEIRTKAYVTGGNVFQFGNNDRRRVNIVPARAVGWVEAEVQGWLADRISRYRAGELQQ